LVWGSTSPMPYLEYGEFSWAPAWKTDKALIISTMHKILPLVVIGADRIKAFI
jgi:hypothetical protein